MGKHKVSSNVLQLNTVKKKRKKNPKKRETTQVRELFREDGSEIGKEKRPLFEDMLTFKFRGVQDLNFDLFLAAVKHVTHFKGHSCT